MNKVAPVTLYFWIMKICATTLGETAGDLLSMTLNVGYAISSLILLSVFLLSLISQLRTRHYHPLLYWTVILTTSTAGTTLSDFMDRTLGLGYATGSLILISLLAVVLTAWRFREKSLSVSHIATTRVELFYWMAILVSNTLGTALGDYLADDSGLGFMGGAGLIGGLLCVVVVLTRPFGATFGDLLTKTPAQGGLGFGTVGSSAILAGLLAAFVIHASVTHKRVPLPA